MWALGGAFFGAFHGYLALVNQCDRNLSTPLPPIFDFHYACDLHGHATRCGTSINNNQKKGDQRFFTKQAFLESAAMAGASLLSPPVWVRTHG
jgi:hypothetical protein